MEKEKLSEIIKESKTLTEVLRKLDLRCAGGNYKTIKKYIEKYDIDISHFDSAKARIDNLRCFVDSIKKPLEEILVKDSTYSRKSLKNRLYKEGLKKRECELCGQGEEWKGNKMGLILDHINGVYNDNRLDNLRIVCPNCNATLDTHCGKHNSKRNKKLIELGLSEKTDLRTVLTENKKISAFNRRKVERPSKPELLAEVEKNGYSATGRKYGVSDNAIRKWLK